MFDVATFKHQLTTQWLGQAMLFFKKLKSTNSYVKQLPAEEISHGLLCLADDQTHGRGQYQKKWESEPGQNLTFTLTFKPAGNSHFHILTLACAKAVIDQIGHTAGLQGTLKWPNDIYVGDKKLGGLLTETTFSGNSIERLLVGLGLNINQTQFPDHLQHKATSLCLLTDKKYSREQFLSELLSRVEYEYGRWHKRHLALLKEINQKVEGYGQWIRLCVNGKKYDAPVKLLGMNEDGQLVVLDEDGTIKTFSYEQIRLITG